MTSKGKIMIAKIMRYIKLKNFCTAKEANNIKRQPMEWEKMIANHVSDKALMSNISIKSYNLIA